MIRRLLPFILLLSCMGFANEPPQLQMVPMSDGVQLATDVYLPEGEGPWPCILVRSTYGRKGLNPDDFLEDGYALAVQDVRGMGKSEGEKYVFHYDGWREGGQDGTVTVAWIKAQPWSNGKIGTFGSSALAMTQMLLAPATDGLSAQYIDLVPADYYHDVIYTGGVFRKNLVEGWLRAIGQPHIIDVYKSHPLDDEYWSYYDTIARAEDITAPGLFVNGWYDIFAQGTLNGFVAREERGGPGARGKNYLIMKWSSHGPDSAPSYKYNENRFEVKVSQVRRAFFDCYLKGETDALSGIPKVQYYTMGADTPGAPGNVWNSAETWPPFEAKETPFFLHADGLLSSGDAPAEPATAAFDYDPKNPYPTHGGANLLPPLVSGPYDQRFYSTQRKDLARFATVPLEAPVEVTGRVRVRLRVSSDAPDTDFTAKLLDIYPGEDGRELNVVEGIQRVKFRKGLSEPAPLLTGPEEVVELEIDMWSTSWVFNTGHRIGLLISSSNYPRWEINPNTGADFPTPGSEMPIAHNVVHLGGPNASAILVPLRPEG
jgi:predicted acyl esterase